MPHGAPAAARAARWRVSQVSGTVMGCQVPSASSASRTTRVREATLAKAAFASAEPAGFPASGSLVTAQRRIAGCLAMRWTIALAASRCSKK